ncbi:MAG: four helix bundle protein [Acidobacteriota bacterium]
MARIERFEDLEVWQTARELARRVYGLSNHGTFFKDFGLRDQMRRAAVSILSNIAEGYESRTQALFIDFLGRAKGSAGELRAQAYVAQDAGHLDEQQCKELIRLAESCGRQLAAFMDYLKATADQFPLRECSPPYESQ